MDNGKSSPPFKWWPSGRRFGKFQCQETTLQVIALEVLYDKCINNVLDKRARKIKIFYLKPVQSKW
jgi:hypothetical protein